MTRPSRASTVLLAPFLAAAWACTPNAEVGTGPAFQVTDSAGVQVARNAGPVPDRFRYEIELTLGVAVGDPDFELGTLTSVRAAADGTIYAIDAQSSAVRIFSADGQALATVGSRGSGPREFSLAAFHLILGPGDTLMIPDALNRRVSRLDPRGNWLEPFPPVPAREWAPYGSDRTVARELFPGDVFMVHDLAAGVADTLLVLSERELPALTAFREGGFNMLLPPWVAWTALESGHLVWGWSDEYRLHVHGPDGRLERIVIRDVTPAPLTARHRDVLLGTWLDYEMPGGGALPASIARVSFGETLPLFSRFLQGPAGTLWVQHLPDVSELDREALRIQGGQRIVAATWDVFDGDGRFLGVAELPPNVRLEHARGDRLYGAQAGPLGEPRIVRLRRASP